VAAHLLLAITLLCYRQKNTQRHHHQQQQQAQRCQQYLA
jgi:hypothetical protein